MTKQKTTQEYVSLNDLVGKLRAPFPQSYKGLKKWLIDEYGEITKPLVKGEGRGRRYIFKQENIDALFIKLTQ